IILRTGGLARRAQEEGRLLTEDYLAVETGQHVRADEMLRQRSRKREVAGVEGKCVRERQKVRQRAAADAHGHRFAGKRAVKEATPAGGREGEGLKPLGAQDRVIEAHAWTIEHLERNLYGVGVGTGSPEPHYYSQRHHTRDHELRPRSVPMSYGHHTTPLV